jgi:chromosome segregation ATPase
MTPDEYNDLWELDRPVLVTLVTELRAELSAAQAALTQAERELELTQSELSNARGEASRLQALIERRRIEGDDTRANAAKLEEIALQFQRERDEARSDVDRLWTMVRAIRIAQAYR